MNVAEMERLLRNLDRRVERIEQILPTLASKADLAGLATKAELKKQDSHLRVEIRAEGERTRRYFDVVAESLRDDIRLLADGFAHLSQRLDQR